MNLDRDIIVTSSAGSFEVKSMDGHEALGRPFEYRLELYSTSDAIELNKVLATPMTVHLQMGLSGIRFFNGIVTRFSMGGTAGRYHVYNATLSPWLWFLSRTSNCRTFQHKSVPDVIKSIFRAQGMTDFEESLSGSYEPWEYMVQYRESDFNFVSRLMEQEGIYYYFKHAEGKHTLVLADSFSAHSAVSGYAKIPYGETGGGARESDGITSWLCTQQVSTGAYAVNDFDYTRPKAKLLSKLAAPKEHPKSDLEMYDYPGEYLTSGEGEGVARIRLEEQQVGCVVVKGAGNARGLTTGALFKLAEYPRDDQNREYLITGASYVLHSDVGVSVAAASGADGFHCAFSAINSHVPFRTQGNTPKPFVQGPQTAIVVGKGGEEIWTDKYGRVKVQFHWDRLGKSDENSSCWVRVAQLWAGTKWGGIHIPRIGQEVIVEFLEGDPDRPIITGRVYNEDNMPPYDLPGNQTQSGIKSRSTKGGTAANFNEFRFEDKKGSEEVYLHAEKNQNIVVENDETHSVGHDRTKDVKRNETTAIGENRTETVGRDETITIGGNRTEAVAKNETITIGGARTESVTKDESVSITGNRTLSTTKNETISTSGARTDSVSKDVTISVGGKQSESIGKDYTLSVGKNLIVTAGDEIILKTGDASITMKKNGDIVIKGKNITVDGSKVNMKASGDVIIKGSKISQN